MSDSWDIIGSAFQGAIQTHGTDRCTGQACVIHNPSDHPLKLAPIHFRQDRLYHAERMCAHMVMHPDPDSVNYLVTRSHSFILLWVHECCSEKCCGQNTDTTTD